MNVVTFSFPKSYVLLESGRITQSDDSSMIGRWAHVVALIEEDGTLYDYIGADLEAANQAAVVLAKDFGVRLFDRSKEEPRP